MRRVPSRHGVHLPQDSYAPKSNTWCTSSGIHVRASNATTPPWPTLAPIAPSSSNPSGVSNSAAADHTGERPADDDALRWAGCQAAAELFDDLPDGYAELDFVEARSSEE